MLSGSRKIKELKAEIDRLRSSVNELKILNEIALSTGRAADIDQILNLIVRKCVDVFDVEQGSILLLTENEKEPFKTIIRQDDSSRLKHTYHIGADITGWVLLNKEPLIIEDLAGDKRFNPSMEEKKDIHSVLCVPIWCDGRLTGLMMLVNKKNQNKFLANELTLFAIISVQAGQLIKNLQLQQENFQRIKEAEKLQELDTLKTNFFTNISHEFRTPLTLILGPAQQIIEETRSDGVRENARLIQRSARNLNRLANQLLDLAKIESGKMKLRASFQDIVPALSEIVSAFGSFAENKDIKLKFCPPKSEVMIFLDMEIFDKIMGNILSNAIKFTPAGGSVEVAVRSLDDEAEISVCDTGIGIPKNHLGKIFDRFYQVDQSTHKEFEGTGVGLSLTRELVELHHGTIGVESEEGRGSTFKVILPLGKSRLQQDEIVETRSSADEDASGDLTTEVEDDVPARPGPGNQMIEARDNVPCPSLLIVEDNSYVRKHIAAIMADQYEILEASNGEEGIKRSFECMPDLIISDVMMPKMDGLQMCAELKKDQRTSHIPVILLTAKAGLEDKIHGLETGADAYISKPFDAVELRASIKNLLNQRKRLQEHFQKFGFVRLDQSRVTSVDQRFLQRVSETIAQQLPDPSFGVDQLAYNLVVSRSLLHKKLTALVGEPPGELIKKFRLNKAASLMELRSGNVTEIAYEVGFNDPSYFAVCFKRQFGISPSHYHKQE